MEELLQDIVLNRQKKNVLLQSMLEVTIRQKAQLAANEVEAMVETTQGWDALAKEIDTLEKNYHQQMQRLSQGNTAHLLAANAEALAKLDAQTQALLKNIQKENEACGTIADGKMQEYKDALKDAKKSSQRTSSYTNAYTISEDGIYFDKKK